MDPKKLEPLVVAPKPHLCPVCGKASYSRSGVHPQCCQASADAATRAKMKAKEARKVAAAALKQK
jgi:hypothetical protein